MKYLSVFSVLMLGALITAAQTKPGHHIPVVNGGAEAGFNLYSATHDPDNGDLKFKPRPGAKLGLFADFTIAQRISIRPGAYWSMKGFEEDYTKPSIFYLERSVTNTFHYLEFPLSVFVRMGHKRNFYVGGGPYAATTLGGFQKVRLKYSPTITDEKKRELSYDDNGSGKDFNRADFGVHASAGWIFLHGLFVQLQFSKGLSNITDFSAKNDYRNIGGTFSLGWCFRS